MTHSMTATSLDAKLARILADRSCRDFILADAKDADMAYGIAAPGRSPEHHAHEARFRSLDEYRELIRQNVRQGLVDIMLMSASTSAVLAIEERLFDDEPRDAGRAGQRHHRHLGGPGRRVPPRAVAAVPLDLDRPGDVRQGRVPRADAAAARAPTWACTPSPSTTTWPWTTGRWTPTRRFARRRRPRGSATSWRSSTPTPRRRPSPTWAASSTT